MTLNSLSEDAFLFPGAVNSVVFTQAGESGQHKNALIVDTGLDESHARKLLRAMQDAGLHLSAILNTHSHADHHGGNAFILKRFPSLPVYAPPLEAAIITHPVLEPLYLYGALPPRELRNKFLLAPSSPAQPIEAGVRTLGGVEVTLISVPGHAAEMYAVQCGGLLYAADALFGPETLAKHPLSFCVDSAAQKTSAADLLALAGVTQIVPGHGKPTGDLHRLVQVNLDSLNHTTDTVLNACLEGAASTDELLARVGTRLELTMTSASEVVLNRSVVAAHLSELLAAGQVQMQVHDNRLVFGAPA